MFEVGQREFPKRAIDRTTEAQPGVIGFADRAPALIRPVDRNDMIVITYGFQVKDQWRMAIHAQSGSREQRALKAVCGIVAHHQPR